MSALDFRGHGDSDYPKELVVGAFAEDLEALLEHLGAPHAVLVGHSLGAHVAMSHAAQCSETPALVLIDPSRGASASRKRATRLALTLRRTYRSREHAIARFRFLPGAARAEESLRRSIAAHSVRREGGGRYGFKFDPRWFAVPGRGVPELRRIRCPTLLLRGSESQLLTAEGARELAQTIPHCELHEIEGAGHHVHLDRPDAVLHLVLGFLRRHGFGGARP